MPTYVRRCEPCDSRFEHFCTIREFTEGIKCPTCSGETSTVWETSGSAGGHGFPYTTDNITGDGKSITITSLAHLRQVEKQYGVCVRGFSDYNGSSAQDALSDAPIYRPNGRDVDYSDWAPSLKPKPKHWWD